MAETTYRTPTPAEKAKLEKARDMMVEGIKEEKGSINQMFPTLGKAARDQQKAATAIRDSVPEAAREGEAYNNSGHKKGGVIKMAKGGSVSSRADGCCVKGKTKGKML